MNTIETLNIAKSLQRWAKERPNSIAILEMRSGQKKTFKELEQESNRLASGLIQYGMKPYERVLLMIPYGIDFITLTFAMFKADLIPVLIDPGLGKKNVLKCIQEVHPQGLIAIPIVHAIKKIFPSPFKSIKHNVTVGKRWFWRGTTLDNLRDLGKIDFKLAPTEKQNPAAILFTSGSTGHPKAAVRTHGFLLAQYRVLEKNIKLVPGEIDLTTLPIFSLANLASGVTSVIPDADMRRPGTVNPVPVLRQIRECRVNRCAASPAFFDCLLQGDDGSLAHLRKILTGGAPVFPRLLNALQGAAPDAMVEAVYGSTEAEPIAHLSASDCSSTDHAMMAEGKGLLGGYPVPEIDLRIITAQWGESIPPLQREAFQAMQLGPYQAGEIVVSGPHVLPGYLHGRGDDETKFRVDKQIWHRTGDAGYQDQSGRIWLLGRCIARIDDTKGIVWPFAVECAAMALDGVRRAALISARGERILIIEAQRTVDTGLLIENLKQYLHWAKLDHIRSVGLLPVDARHNAKIDYPALRQMLESN